MEEIDSPIQYFAEDREVPEVTSNTSPWLIEIADNYGFKIENINYIFCSDEYLLDINKTYLEHDYYTDIITFDNSEEDGYIESDIFISIDRVNDNEEQLNVPRGTEILRVMTHGLLHHCGLKDKSESEANEMRKAEEASIGLWQNKFAQ
jgi:rRNA maturation RNase YbeY